MNPFAAPIVSDLVLIGGGHSHVHVLKMLGMPPLRQFLARSGIRVTLIAKDVWTPYSGMLPGFVAGHYTYDQIHLDLAKICRFADITLIHASCTRIEYERTGADTGSGWCHCDDGRPPVRFDCISIDIGSTPAATADSLIQHPRVIPVKPISEFTTFYQKLKGTFRDVATSWSETETEPKTNGNTNGSDKPPKRSYTVCVVGGGAGGIELMLSVQYNLRQLIQQKQSKSKGNGDDSEDVLNMVLVTRGSELLIEHNPRVRRKFQRVLKERNIRVYFNCDVVGVEQSPSNGKEDTTARDDTTESETESNSYQPQYSAQSRSRLIVRPSKYASSSATVPSHIEFDDCLWCTSAAGAGWLANDTHFPTDGSGFVRVDNTYQITDHPGAFACGDCCHMTDHPRPKAGVFAVRAGPPLVDNIMNYLTSRPLVPHIPQSSFLGILSTGDPYAIASKGSYLALEGKWIWTWKDYIDRTWMSKYSTDIPDKEEMMQEMKNELERGPSLSSRLAAWSPFSKSRFYKKFNGVPENVKAKGKNVLEAFSADPMRCGGCGAKVGSTSLSRVLKALHRRQIQRAEQYGLPKPPSIDHDDAAIVPLPQASANGTGGAFVHTIDYFRSIVDDPYVFGKIAAVHALSDVHAMGAEAQTALSLAVVPFCADEAIVESTLLQLLSGMNDVLQDEGIRLIGGHTCEGVELSCGVVVHGYAPDTSRLLRKRGGRVGDKIILTKPIGTGALFAADMRAKCNGLHMVEAIASMQKSNRPASQAAMNAPRGAVRSCTDVTGFGLIGHLIEMLLANDEGDGDKLQSIGASIRIHDVPFLAGGLEAAGRGIFSSLQPQNTRNRRAVGNHTDAAKACPEKYPLLFDPQTAGGLMMFVDPDHCDAIITSLHEEDVDANVIGELVAYETRTEISSEQVCSIGGDGSTSERIHIQI